MSETRRGFLSKLGIGSIIISTAGVFKVAEAQQSSIPEEAKSIYVEQLNEEQFAQIACDILDALDGKCKNHVIQEAVRAHLTKGTIYEKTSKPDIEKIAEP